MKTTTVSLVLAVLLALSVAGCDDDDPTAPGIEPEIINSAESFEFQVSQVRNYSGNLQYTWSNAETSANVDESASISSGSIRLVVSDASGTVVFDADVEDGSMATANGVAGDWTVVVRFRDATGDANFRLQPRTE